MSEDLANQLEELTEICSTKAFLSKEYLTWLWYYIEETGGEIEINLEKQEKPIEIWIDDKIILEDPSAGAQKYTLNGGNPSSSPEATVGLVTGKIVTELKLGLIVDEEEFSFTLGHKDLAPRSIGLPKNQIPSHDPDSIISRVDAIAKLIEVTDQLFILFLEARVEESWAQTELHQIRDWIHQRSDGEPSLQAGK